jgi:hypothetical protein
LSESGVLPGINCNGKEGADVRRVTVNKTRQSRDVIAS